MAWCDVKKLGVLLCVASLFYRVIGLASDQSVAAPTFAGGAIADSVQARAQQTAPRILGRFRLASFDGFVSLQDSGNDLMVDVIVVTDVLVGSAVMPGGRA